MDWDDAYVNDAHVPGAEGYPPRWEADAAAFRESLGARAGEVAYGPSARQRMAVFRPEGASAGLAVFVHGGYWMKFDQRSWSHLAAGALARGLTVAMPGYSLCPEVRIPAITRGVGTAIGHAAGLADGPIWLAGHSAGGHLISRMICRDTPLPEAVTARIARVLSISGVHDLRPLMRTPLNATLGLDAAEAVAESPVLNQPLEGARLTCWVGAGERPEFVRQNALLANIWTGLGAKTRAVEDPDRHHFNVIDGLTRPDSPLMRAWMDDD